MASKPFRIAHLSDPHLTRDDNRARSEPKLWGALKGMNQAFRAILKTAAVQQADRILVTGDIADRGEIESWKVFWQAVTDAELMQRTTVLPGNHDVCLLDLMRFPNKDLAKRDLQKAINGLRLGGQPTKFPWVFQPDPRVVIFGLNSNNLGNVSAASNAMGFVHYYQLKELASQLHQHRDVPVKIVALHHSPNIPEEATARKRNQHAFGRVERLTHQIPEEGRRGIILLCVAHRVRLLVHGHLHMQENRRITGVRIIGAPAVTQPLDVKAAVKQYQFWTYTVHGDGGRVSPKLQTVRA